MAAPIAMAVVSWAGGTAAVGGAMGVALIEVGVGLAMSALSRMILGGQQQDAQESPGIRTNVTMEGGTLPQTMIIGKYKTGGYVVAPYYSVGKILNVGETDYDIENAYRWIVLDLADSPITNVTRLWVNGTKFNNPADFTGDIMNGFERPKASAKPAWTKKPDVMGVRVRDGRQTAADPLLVGQLGSHPKRPWTNNHIGKGVAYAFFQFRFDPDLHRGEPQILFEVEGAPLYDRRSDTTNGGTGTQREADQATWAYSANTVVQIENIMRGIVLADGYRWGVGFEWADLPANSWNPAKTAANELLASGRRRYTSGYEIRMATPDAGGDTPLDNIDRLLKACAGEMVDVGGTAYISVGGHALPSFHITDDDLIVEEPQEAIQHEGNAGKYNSIRVRYPNPNQQWNMVEAPIRRNATWPAQDGEPLFADLPLEAVFEPGQAQQLGAVFIKDSRNTRAHTIGLGPKHSRYVPLETFTWTSAKYGYSNKLFVIQETAIDPLTLCCVMSVLEGNPADYDEETHIIPGDPDDTPRERVVLPLKGFNAVGGVLKKSGVNRRPAFHLTWNADYTGVRRLTYESRIKATLEEGPTGTITNIRRGEAFVAAGVLPDTQYEVRAKANGTDWCPWITLTTPAVRFTAEDLADDEITRIIRGFFPKRKILTNNTTNAWVEIGRLDFPDEAGYPLDIDLELTIEARGKGWAEVAVYRNNDKLRTWIMGSEANGDPNSHHGSLRLTGTTGVKPFILKARVARKPMKARGFTYNVTVSKGSLVLRQNRK